MSNEIDDRKPESGDVGRRGAGNPPLPALSLIRRSSLKRSTKPIKRSRINPKRKSKAERDRIESVRRVVFERDGYRCRDCGKRVKWNGEWWERGHAAHVIPVSRGGEFIPSNLLTKCPDCHLVKEHNPKPCPKKPSLSDLTSPGTAIEGGCMENSSD